MIGSESVVVVTGASAGVGRATVQAFAGRGARLGLLARDRDRLEATRREVEAMGGRALVLPTDVASADAVESAAAAVEEAFGPIDVWINNAMVSVLSPIAHTPADEFKRVTDVTYLGCVYGTLAALRRMQPRDHGVIVQVSSALAHRSIPLQAAYCAAKHAVVGFTDSLRCELIHDGSQVRVTAVHLPALNTPQFSWVKNRLPRQPQPVPPIFQPEVAAEAIMWAAAHPERRELLVGWPTVQAIWGQKFLPGFLDHYLGRSGYESQQDRAHADPHRANNLWDAVPGTSYAAHGDFDHRARSASTQLWLTTHRSWVASAAAAFVAATVAAVRRR